MAMTAAPDTRLLLPSQEIKPAMVQPEAPGDPASLLRPGHALVTLPAEIDACNDLQVLDQLTRAALETGTAVLVADARQTAFCGCAGVTVLICAHHRAAAAGTQLRLVAGQPPMLRMLQLTGADRVLHIYPTLAAALAAPDALPAPR